MKKHISPINNLKNLNLIINSDTYKLAHEDIGLLSRNEMRGVRMLLEITKPDLILEENKILSTIIIFGGASITEEANIKKRLENIEELLKKNPKSILLKRNLNRLENLLLMSNYYQSAREFSKLASINNQSKSDEGFFLINFFISSIFSFVFDSSAILAPPKIIMVERILFSSRIKSGLVISSSILTPRISFLLSKPISS